MPIGPGPESVAVELWAANPNAGRWDRAVWDGTFWSSPSWQAVGCQLTEAQWRWGSQAEAGILSLAAAGELDLQTYDPSRVLDPINTSSPLYGAVRAGTPVRVVGKVPGDVPAVTAYVDEASHDVASSRGRLRAIDGIAYLAQAEIADGVTLPDTLRARTRAVVAAVGLASVVPVEPEAPTDPDVDPPVAPHDLKSAAAWAIITRAAEDALTYVWLDPTGTLRFRSWGSLPDAPFAGIGCPPPGTDPGEEWIEGVSTLESVTAADTVRNSVRAYSSGTTWAPYVTDGPSVAKYGPRPFEAPRVVPDRATWASRILADRADAGLEVGVGQVRPYTQAELAALLAMNSAGACVVRVRDDAHGDPIDLNVAMIGATVGVTPAGWRFALVTFLSRVEWDAVTPDPPDPPDPPTDPWHVETRSYIASSDALITLTSGGAKYGAGAATTLPVGTWQGWTYRGLLKFPTIPWTKVRAIRSATLHLRSTTQVRVGFGSSPKTEVRRITEAWSAGGSSSPSSGNAVVWPGPSTTSTGAVTATLPTGQNVDKNITVTALVRAWAPTSIGGSAAPQQGLRLGEYSGSGSNTGEVWPVEQGGAARPELTLELEVFD